MRYLILSASYGNGHNAARDALISGLDSQTDSYELLDMFAFLESVANIDVIKAKLGATKTKKSEFYMTEQFPRVWNVVKNVIDHKMTGEIMEMYIRQMLQKAFNHHVETYCPDVIISVYPMWGTLIQGYLEDHPKTFTTGVIITDCGEPDTSWYSGAVAIDHFFVIDAFSKSMFLKKFEHTLPNVHASFFPIEEKYVSDKHILRPERFMFLLSGVKNTFAVEFLEKLRYRLFFKEMNIIRGRNPALYQKLQNIYTDKRFHYKEWIQIKDSLPEIDIFVGKPGGAILSECVAQDVFFVAPNFISNEKGNVDFMFRNSVGIYDDNVDRLLFTLENLDYNQLLTSFHKIKKRQSVRYILDCLCDTRSKI